MRSGAERSFRRCSPRSRELDLDELSGRRRRRAPGRRGRRPRLGRLGGRHRRRSPPRRAAACLCAARSAPGSIPTRAQCVIASAAAMRPRRSREGKEERVTLRVHLDAALGGARLPDQPAVLGESLRVAFAPSSCSSLRRALDVGEEERDGAGGKIAPHRRHHAPKLGTRHAREANCGPPRERDGLGGAGLPRRTAERA